MPKMGGLMLNSLIIITVVNALTPLELLGMIGFRRIVLMQEDQL